MPKILKDKRTIRFLYFFLFFSLLLAVELSQFSLFYSVGQIESKLFLWSLSLWLDLASYLAWGKFQTPSLWGMNIPTFFSSLFSLGLGPSQGLRCMQWVNGNLHRHHRHWLKSVVEPWLNEKSSGCLATTRGWIIKAWLSKSGLALLALEHTDSGTTFLSSHTRPALFCWL